MGKYTHSFRITLDPGQIRSIDQTNFVLSVCGHSLHNSDCLEEPQDLEHAEGLDDPQHPAAALLVPQTVPSLKSAHFWRNRERS